MTKANKRLCLLIIRFCVLVGCAVFWWSPQRTAYAFSCGQNCASAYDTCNANCYEHGLGDSCFTSCDNKYNTCSQTENTKECDPCYGCYLQPSPRDRACCLFFCDSADNPDQDPSCFN